MYFWQYFFSVVAPQSISRPEISLQFWCCFVCFLSPFLYLKVLLQRLQGMATPSRWFASMWSFMALPMPSFPQTLHRSANWRPFCNLFWLFSIIDFTLSSSSSRSPEKLLGMASDRFSLGFGISGICLLKEDLGENRTLVIHGNNSGDFAELDTKVKSMMEKSQNKTANGHCLAHRCKVCGKEGRSRDIKDHIEANHLEGIIIPCNLCDKTFRSRNGFRLHKSRHHTNNWFMC